MDRDRKFHKFVKRTGEPEVFRVKLPRGKQVLGIVDTRLGFGKSTIRCTDDKARICRVPGAIKRMLWVRPGDVVIVEPWEIEGDKKGDIVHKFKPTEVDWLKRNGHLKNLFEKEEF